MERLARSVGAGILVLAVAVGAFNVWSDGLPQNVLNRVVPPTAIPLAVLGDSTSHSYQDSVAFPPGSGDRGGALRSRTFNWNEILARLRPGEVDSGPWMAWGRSGIVAAGRELLGMEGGRAPRKEDYLYNFANSGASCRNLTRGPFRQASRLVVLMDKEPERWKRGVVVIRIGLNDWAPLLDKIASDPEAPALRTTTQQCADRIGEAISLIQGAHPAVRVLVVGIMNEADDPGYVSRFLSQSESANINKALDTFNDALRQVALRGKNTAFFDDSAWFRERWGERAIDGKPAYKTVTVSNAFKVDNTAGDDPENALVADHHAGLVWNALWAQSLVLRLREAFALPLTPISDEEVARFVLPLVQPQPGK